MPDTVKKKKKSVFAEVWSSSTDKVHRLAGRSKKQKKAQEIGQKAEAKLEQGLAADPANERDEGQGVKSTTTAALEFTAAVATAKSSLNDEKEAIEKARTRRLAGKVMYTAPPKPPAPTKPAEPATDADKLQEDVDKFVATLMGDASAAADASGTGPDGDEKLLQEAKALKARLENALPAGAAGMRPRVGAVGGPLGAVEKHQVKDEAFDSKVQKTEPVGAAGLLAAGGAKIADPFLADSNKDDNIAGDSGMITHDLQGVVASLAVAFQEIRAYPKSHGAARKQHLHAAATAVNESVSHLTSLTRNTLKLTDSAGAMEAGSAVPILGIVAACPILIEEMNLFRSAIVRHMKQADILEEIEGDATQSAVAASVRSFLSTDEAAMGKQFARICMDFTKIAGHAVTLGGVTGPVGVALVGVGVVGKGVISMANMIEGYVHANKANDHRKALDKKDADGGEASRKSIKHDPQLSAQVTIDQALRELEQDPNKPGTACKVLMSFGIKIEQMQTASAGKVKTAPTKEDPRTEKRSDEALVSVREMRQYMLYKLGAEDETAQTFTQDVKEVAGDAKKYFAAGKVDEVKAYMKAKDILEYRGKKSRFKWTWVSKMVILTDDIEESKAAMLKQVDLLIEEGQVEDSDPQIVEVKKLLMPRDEKKKAA